MSEPMKYEQATKLFPEDTLSSTCSMRCENCNERIWFVGELHNQAYSYVCPYCNDRSYHYLVLEKRKRIDSLVELAKLLRRN